MCWNLILEGLSTLSAKNKGERTMEVCLPSIPKLLDLYPSATRNERKRTPAEK